MAERYGDAEFGDNNYSRPRSGGGCMKGCLIGCGILFVLGLIAIGVVAYYGVQFAKNLITTDPTEIEKRLDECVPGAKMPENYEGKFGMRMKFPFMPIQLDMLFVLPKEVQARPGDPQPKIRDIFSDSDNDAEPADDEKKADEPAKDDAKKDDAKKDDAKKDADDAKKKPITFFQIIRFKIDDPNVKGKPQFDQGIEKQLRTTERKQAKRVIDGVTIDVYESKYETDKGKKLEGLDVPVDENTTISAISPAGQADEKAIGELLRSSLGSIKSAKKNAEAGKSDDKKADDDASKGKASEPAKADPVKSAPPKSDPPKAEPAPLKKAG